MSSKTLKYLVNPLFISILLIISSANAFAESDLSVEQRLNRLENLLQNQVLVEQTQKMEQIQQELSALRELVEAQEHQLGLLKQRQRNLYQDMDRRLNDLEIKGGGGSVSSGLSSGAASSASSVPPPGSATAASNIHFYTIETFFQLLLDLF